MLRSTKSLCKSRRLFQSRFSNFSIFTSKALIRFARPQSNKNEYTERKMPHIVKNRAGESTIIITQKVHTNNDTIDVDLREHRSWFRVADKKMHYAFRVVNGELAVLKNVDSILNAQKLLEKEIVKCFINPESQETFIEYIEKNYGLLITELFPEYGYK